MLRESLGLVLLKSAGGEGADDDDGCWAEAHMSHDKKFMNSYTPKGPRLRGGRLPIRARYTPIGPNSPY